ncbi:MAG: arsenic resistance N-acetyltransferase ArsN2 [Pseudomonadota bacterium]
MHAIGAAADLRAALAAEKLPVDDLTEAGRSFFRVTRGGATVGFAGYELHGHDVLLRSIVVLPGQKGQGIGAAALRLVIAEAMRAGARQAYLLTASAAPFFEKHGFTPVDRGAVPAAILSSRQAAALCPASATILTRQLPV